ncbi:MAG: putative toxin-antitoxin system toxin component, PIN family [Thermoplasmata archaeon]|nr:MAG: putative toxin-antitoxin system toxin component, PIN family [Thermoplasmata archaeon]
MNLIIDTNIIFSALYSEESPAAHLIQMAIFGEMRLFSPEHVKNELERILITKLSYKKEEITDLFESLPISWIESKIYEDKVKEATKLIKDKDDVPIVACSLATGYAIVTGDKHFLPVKKSNIKVLRLRDFKE